MPRPRKPPGEARDNIVTIRLNDDEFDSLKRAALAAGVTYGEYARATILGRRPKAVPVRDRVFNQLMYELGSIATNFRQLETATGGASYGEWAAYIGDQLASRLLDRNELIPLIEDSMAGLNHAGQLVNDLAKKANSGADLKKRDVDEATAALKEAVKPLHDAVKPGAKRQHRDDGGRGR
jgi:hypothetical protein